MTEDAAGLSCRPSSNKSIAKESMSGANAALIEAP
jgi:hypothetical protein